MPYIYREIVAGRVKKISKYYTTRIHPKGVTRGAREKPTSESVERNNLRRAKERLELLLDANFEDGDYLLRLDYTNDKAAGIEITDEYMQKAVSKFLRKVKSKVELLKYVYVKEIGPKGGRHIHMVINKTDSEIIRNCWKGGGIHIDPLYSDGDYSKIAEYFLKYAQRTEKTLEAQGVLVGKRKWSSSKNLEKPKVKKK